MGKWENGKITNSTEEESKKVPHLPERDKQPFNFLPIIYHLSTAQYGCNQSDLTNYDKKTNE